MGTKEELLKLLEENKDNFISGEEVATRLGLSRNSIWKAIENLRKEGYIIDSKSNQGYSLNSRNNILNEYGIIKYLNTKIFGRNIEIHELIDSTNQRGKELIAQGGKTGTLILANQQTLGRGRRGRNFYSPSSTGIYMSLIIRPENHRENMVKFTTMAALATCEAIEEVTGLKPRIKWVNDIYLKGKKIVGILTEATANLEDGSIDGIVLGIGINVSTKDFPEDIKNIATSLDEEINRNHLIAIIMNKLEKLWLEEEITPHITKYKDRLMMLNKEVKVLDPMGEYNGFVTDLDEEGRLIVRLEDGSERVLNSGELSIKGEYNEE
ncbi:MAG: biotin--[acetyl-CoA-carboxylase] ligase [Filifactoraceae bacterium]